MKNIIRFTIILIFISILTMAAKRGQSQPDPPPPPVQHGYNGNVPVSGAPLGNGSEVLILFGLFYAARNYIQVRKRETGQGKKQY